jgi:hypothetical protein
LKIKLLDIQELRAEHFSLVQAAPAMDSDKVMRLRAQTAKMKGGLFFFQSKHIGSKPIYVS